VEDIVTVTNDKIVAAMKLAQSRLKAVVEPYGAS